MKFSLKFLCWNNHFEGKIQFFTLFSHAIKWHFPFARSSFAVVTSSATKVQFPVNFQTRPSEEIKGKSLVRRRNETWLDCAKDSRRRRFCQQEKVVFVEKKQEILLSKKNKKLNNLRKMETLTYQHREHQPVLYEIKQKGNSQTCYVMVQNVKVSASTVSRNLFSTRRHLSKRVRLSSFFFRELLIRAIPFCWQRWRDLRSVGSGKVIVALKMFIGSSARQ